MGTRPGSSADPGYMDKALDVAVRLAVIAAIVMWCFSIFRPLMMPVIWAIIIALALYPVVAKLKKVLVGRNRVAGVLFILIRLAIVIVPAAFLAGSLVDGNFKFEKALRDGTLC